ncbi:MAG: sigma-70 family RNA polymerase sigma factor, partial [Dehalococcoidia bacterium]
SSRAPCTYIRWTAHVYRVTEAVCSDDDLVAGLHTGSAIAFESLYDQYGDAIYSVALRVLADPVSAQDVVQDVFVRLWKNPTSYDPGRGRLLPWLLSVTRNRAVDEIRSRGRRRLRELEPPGDGMDDPVDVTAIDPAQQAVLASEQRAVRGALMGLPAEQREVIELAYFGGLTQQEISARLATPLGTVKTRVRLAMRKLRVTLGPAVGMTGVQ